MSVLNDRVRWKLSMRNDDGVASVIGTIFALLVFITLLSLIITSYIPAWEKENEQEFMTETLFRFSTLKSVNVGVAEGQQQFVAMPLAPSKVPIFGKTLLGELSYHPSDVAKATMTLTFNSNDTSDLEFQSGGSLQYRVFANTQLSEVVSYELGAVVVSQPDGGLIRVSPEMSTNTITVGPSTLYDLTISMNDLIGLESSRIGTGIAGVSLTVDQRIDEVYTMGAADREATLVIESPHADIWANWLEQRFVLTGVISALDLTVDDDNVTVNFSDLNSIQVKRTFTIMSLE